jgi:hypothetical protein
MSDNIGSPAGLDKSYLVIVSEHVYVYTSRVVTVEVTGVSVTETMLVLGLLPAADAVTVAL